MIIPNTTAIGADQTTDKVKTTPAQVVNPEFVNIHGMESMFGIKRGLAYNLMESGDIKGVSLRRRGQNRGKRLFVVDSVRAYLNAQMLAAGDIRRN